MKNIYLLLVVLLAGLLFFTACEDEELGDTIFRTDIPDVDESAYDVQFQKFLNENFNKPYNLAFRYKMEDRGADMDYNLVPATLENAKKMAVLVKYLWFDVYSDVVDTVFLRANGPRIIHLIGSPAYNPANGTMILGLAEGGIKISLFRVNDMDMNNMAFLNEMYFKTMHHEFAHVLHQKKIYPPAFNELSYMHYDPFAWQDRHFEIAASLGFASPYGSSQTREDFVEIIANYVVKTDTDWNDLLETASKGWTVVEAGTQDERVEEADVDTDGVDGRAMIERKLSMCRQWLSSEWGFNLDSLRAEVQKRQKEINDEFVNNLLKIEGIE